MSTRYVCDWCGNEYDDRANVASADVTIGSNAEQLHMCVDCAPDFLRKHYPEEPKPIADGGETEPPTVSVGDRVTLCAIHSGENEYVHGVVNEVHNPKCVDVLYRIESRKSNGGDGRFRRDSHTDTYEFATSCVYMADTNGWLKGWDDA